MSNVRNCRAVLIASLTALVLASGGVHSDQLTTSSPVSESKITYGSSVKGRPLIAFILGKGDNVTMISGGVHGNETSAPGLVEKLHRYLLDHPDEVVGSTIVLIPNVNPDGDAAHKRANAHGVDLNRNFPGDWQPKRTGIKLSPGTGPLSEPEAAGLAALIERTQPQKVVSVHQPFHMLVAGPPYGTQLATAMQAENHYRISDNVGYPTPGSFGTYLSNRGIACVTLELPWQSDADAWAANRNALLAAIHFHVSQPSEQSRP